MFASVPIFAVPDSFVADATSGEPSGTRMPYKPSNEGDEMSVSPNGLSSNGSLTARGWGRSLSCCVTATCLRSDDVLDL